MVQVIVVGGGLAGLLNAILLARAGVATLVIEKKHYPFHKVCGEYISNEVTPFLKELDLFPDHLNPVEINQLLITSHMGRSGQFKLPLGGFGVSRFHLDHFWYERAASLGVQFLLGTTATAVDYHQGSFRVETDDSTLLSAQVVVGAYGKRSRLDRYLGRSFVGKRSPYVGIKYHVRYPWKPQLIALHNFEKGYCGVSMVEDGKVNFCYLTHRQNLKTSGSIESLENTILARNPHLKTILKDCVRLFDQPQVINEVSFAPKKAVENHILMTGDAAGMITPLCGNGMAMAIRSAYLLAPKIIRFLRTSTYSRTQLELDYRRVWDSHFTRRLSVGRQLQKLFQHRLALDMLIATSHFPPLARSIVRQTHGKAFPV